MSAFIVKYVAARSRVNALLPVRPMRRVPGAWETSGVAVVSVCALAVLLLLGSCGGGGGDGGAGGGTPDQEVTGVFSGYSSTGNLDWDQSTGGDGSDGTSGDGTGSSDGAAVGPGSDGVGGIGVGGDLGQFIGANVCVFLDGGRQLGCALTDDVKGMVTVKPGRTYTGGLRIEISGTANARYYEEGRDTYVPFPADRKIRAWVPAIRRNVGVTPFTEAAYRVLTEGSTPVSVGAAQPTAAQITAANDLVRQLLNEQFPTALQVDDITRLPYLKSPSVTAGSMRTDPRGRYGLVNGAFSKQASFHNADVAAPTLEATRQLAEDLLDGKLDGRNGSQLAGSAGARTYEPHTLTGELSAALGQQAERFGAQVALDALPPVLNYGNVRYKGYLFDGSIDKGGAAFSTVTGWLGGNEANFVTGQQFSRLPAGHRALALYGNNGHGGGFYKAQDAQGKLKLFAIGDNVNGELGLGNTLTTDAKAVEVSLPGLPSHLAGGFAHTVARMPDGSVWAWGDNQYGQLGQGGSAGTSSTTPLRVTLPVAAIAVAAASVSSYALGVDGKVYAWGSNGGFGLLGNGSAAGVNATPTTVSGLDDIVQIAARDNDVVVLRRDYTVWQWGSHPVPDVAFVAGDPAQPYAGGNRVPVQVAGLPASQRVRKVLTEQGLFAVLLDNGHVYTWGVHFDITAGDILRGAAQMVATRMLSLPPIRDMMPGGFQGYGERAFDRLTAMGVDYDGGLWKIRGRVGEVYDPATETTRGAQRRPQGQGARPDCESCHTFFDQTLRALEAASRQPTSGSVCEPPPEPHQGATASLIHAETQCVTCHNPARLNYPITTPSGTHPFAANGGWPDCVKPSNLPARQSVEPTLLTNACEVPPRHVYTPPGTVCATCHNSVLARPLREMSTACAQPDSKLLPTIATQASVVAVTSTTGLPLSSGAVTNVTRHVLGGSLTAPLAAGQTLAVDRNGTLVGTATVNGTTWTFDAGTVGEGPHTYRARVVAGTQFGAWSNVWTVVVDVTPPTLTASITGFTDEVIGSVAPGGFASDTTPQVNGTLSGALAVGDRVEVLRDGARAGLATASALNWSYTETTPVAAGVRSYQARVVDAAGNAGATSAAGALTVVAGLPAVTIDQALNDTVSPAIAVVSGSSITDRTPTLTGTLSADLAAGQTVRLLRDGVLLGAAATVSGRNWTLGDALAADGSFSYTARVQAGGVIGSPSAAFALVIDTIPPTQVANVTQIADDINGTLALPATTADTTPTVRGTLSAALAPGEQVRVLRGGNAVGTASVSGLSWSFTEQAPGIAIPSGSTSAFVTYAARVVDAAGQNGPATGSTLSVTVTPSTAPLANAATITRVNGRTDVNAAEVSYATATALDISLARALLANEVVAVYRNTGLPVTSAPPCGIGTAVQVATRTATQWGSGLSGSVTTAALSGAPQTVYFIARVEQSGSPSICGANTNTASSQVVAPLVVQATGATDPNGVSIAGGNTALAPRVSGTLSPALRSGERVVVVRTAVPAGTAVTLNASTAAGSAWTFNEPAVPAVGSYSYAARSVDVNGLQGGLGASVSVNVVAVLPSVATIDVDGAVGGFVRSTTPTVGGDLSAALPSGASVRVYRAQGTSTCTTLGTASCPAVGQVGTAGLIAWSFTDTNVGQGDRRYRARVEFGSAYGAASIERVVTVDTVAPAQQVTSLGAFTSVMPNTTVSGASPNGNSIANAGLTNDDTPRLRVVLDGALATGDNLRIFRDGVAVVDATRGTSCGATCFDIDLPSQATLTNNASGAAVSSTVPTTTGLPTAQRVYTVRVVDAAGNLGAVSSGFSMRFGYLDCDFARADATYSLFRSGANHPAWSGATCASSSCHIASSTASPTAAGTLVRVPAGTSTPTAPTPSYWCRRP